MAKSAGPGVCVHCVKNVPERNWDHVLPESWYPNTTPQNMEKWKVPSCITCNREYGKIEQDLLIRLGLCLDPNHPDTKSLTEKALRSIKPEFGKNRRDKRARERKQKKILRGTSVSHEVPKHGVLPNFGPAHEAGEEGYISVNLPKHDLDRIAEKIVRGIAFVENGIFIDDKYSLDIFVLNDEGAKEIIDIINKFGVTLSRGAAITVRKATIPEDPKSGLYAIEIWGKVKLYASVMPVSIA